MDKTTESSAKPTVAEIKPWINAWRDTLALFDAYPQNMLLCDIAGDGDTRLLVADEKNKLTCYQGTTICWQTKLLDSPICIQHFYQQQTNPSKKIRRKNYEIQQALHLSLSLVSFFLCIQLRNSAEFQWRGVCR